MGKPNRKPDIYADERAAYCQLYPGFADLSKAEQDARIIAAHNDGDDPLFGLSDDELNRQAAALTEEGKRAYALGWEQCRRRQIRTDATIASVQNTANRKQGHDTPEKQATFDRLKELVRKSPDLTNTEIANTFYNADQDSPSPRTLADSWIPRAKRELRSTP